MIFGTPLLEWDFKAREKRFFVYGQLPGQVAHCANTGSMKGLIPGAVKVWVNDFGADTARKLRYSAEILRLESGVMVGINTHKANALVGEAVAAGLIGEVSGEVRAEVKLDAKTRFDFKVGETWVEVKNVTLAEGGVAMFPDSVTERGAKHLRELQAIVEAGGKALQVYLVQRGDCSMFEPATAIDPVYAAGLKAAAAAGVQVIALGCTVTPDGITVDRRLPVVV
jgi:sugar fermentation stimulation protein A